MVINIFSWKTFLSTVCFFSCLLYTWLSTYALQFLSSRHSGVCFSCQTIFRVTQIISIWDNNFTVWEYHRFQCCSQYCLMFTLIVLPLYWNSFVWTIISTHISRFMNKKLILSDINIWMARRKLKLSNNYLKHSDDQVSSSL